MIPRTPRNIRQHGGITILVALALLLTATVAAFSLGGSAFREALITGNEGTGRKAYEMADSGVDWALTYLTPGPAALSGAAGTLATQFETMTASIGTGTDAGASTMMLADGTIRINGAVEGGLLAADLQGEMTPGTTGWLQNSVVKPAFDVDIWYLGKQLGKGATTSGKKAAADTSYYLLMRTTGRANVGDTGQSFISRREAIVHYIPTN